MRRPLLQVNNPKFQLPPAYYLHCKMRKSDIVLASFLFTTTHLFLLAGAIDNVGGNICNTNDDKVFTTELTKSIDATLFGFQNRIAAGEERFMAGTTKNGIRRALLKFPTDDDDNTFPSDTKVECTEIRLITTRSDEERRTVPTPVIKVHRVATQWTTTGGNNLQLHGLNGGTANARDTTWKYSSYPSTEWENSGGDFYNNVLGRNVEAGDLHWYGKTRAMAEVVQEWIDEPSTNFGFILIGSDETYTLPPPGSYSRYNGIESSPDLIPRLIVTYTSPSQGKPHRAYNDYIPVAPDDNSSDYNSDNDGVTGLIIGGIIASLVSSAIMAVVWQRQ